MADGQVITRTNENGTKLHKIRVAWTAEDDATKADVELGAINGRIVQFVTDPGSPAPAANYDITLVDEDSIDVSGGALTDLHTTTTEINRPTDGTNLIDRWTMGNHTLTFANITNVDAQGVISIFYIAE